MEEREFKDNVAKLKISDPDIYAELLKQYEADPYASWDVLATRAGAALKRASDLVKLSEGRAKGPLSDAFGVDAKQVLQIIDMDSPNSWLGLPTKELQKAAIEAGYMKKLPADADEAAKEANRKGFDKFLKVLGTESVNRRRQKLLDEYESTKFTESPVEWTKKMVNDLLFRTYSKRAKEQILRGEGATSFGTMDNQDRATLGLDIGANSLYGAGAGGLAMKLADGGLRSGATLFGSDFAAGVLGGLTDAYNRAYNTRAGILPYEWVTEPVAGGMANSLMAPGLIREAAGRTMAFMGGGKLGDVSRRGMMGKVADVLSRETGWPEANLASTLDDLAGATKYGDAPMTKETAKKVQEMADIWGDGLTLAPGEEQTLFDGLQALYEASFRNGKPPSNLEFSNIVGKKADELASARATAGAKEARQLERETAFYRNAKEMLDNGIMDAETMLREVGPEPLPIKNPQVGRTSGEVFELKGPAVRDEMVMRQYADDVQKGNPVPQKSGEILDLSRRYPDFGKYVDYVDDRTVMRNGEPFMYGVDFLPPKYGSNREFARNVLGGLEYAGKPVLTNIAMNRYLKEDESEDAVNMAFDNLMAEKPEATRAAYEGRFDPDLPGPFQLTPEERALVNRKKDMEQARVLGIKAR